MPLPDSARNYLLMGLAASPAVIRALVDGLATGDPRLDKRPDPQRFTIREILAHLADWEPIWLDRLTRIAEGEVPFLPSVDESRMAIEHDYAGSDPSTSLAKFAEGRAALVEFLGSVTQVDWDRTGNREFVGVLTLQQQAAFALCHDAYHERQLAEWLKTGPS